jgi:hypothetical protein
MAVVVGRTVEWARLGARTATLTSRASIGHGDKEQIGVARREVSSDEDEGSETCAEGVHARGVF